MSIDGIISRIDGLLLFSGIVAYTVFLIKEARRQGVTVVEGADDIAPPQPLWKNIILLVVGLVMLVLGSQWLVDGAVEIAKYFGLSELVIGLTIVAVGTSLPELATSVMASLKGERDIAVGNILGSNIFNIGVVLGLSGMVAPDGLPVAQSSLVVDIPVMILVAFACLPVFLANYTVTRSDGVAFLVCYVVYVLYVVLAAQQSAMLATMMPFLLVVVAVCVTWWMLEVLRYLRRQASSWPPMSMVAMMSWPGCGRDWRLWVPLINVLRVGGNSPDVPSRASRKYSEATMGWLRPYLATCARKNAL